jgi:hypothetical protein
MGDRNPKSITKQATQKQARNAQSNQRKEQAALAKQAPNKKT